MNLNFEISFSIEYFLQSANCYIASESLKSRFFISGQNQLVLACAAALRGLQLTQSRSNCILVWAVLSCTRDDSINQYRASVRPPCKGERSMPILSPMNCTLANFALKLAINVTAEDHTTKRETVFKGAYRVHVFEVFLYFYKTVFYIILSK